MTRFEQIDSMLRPLARLAAVLGLMLLALGPALAAPDHAVTATRLEPPGPLFVTKDGREEKIADLAYGAWILRDGRDVAYAGEGGADGYENEGQGLFLYDVARGTSRRLYAAPFQIDSVDWVALGKAAGVFLVSMHDGGLGASHFAIVDERSGRVALRRRAAILDRQGEVLTIGYYRIEDWGRADAKPIRTERRNIRAFLHPPRPGRG
jgi:hypothetical protein